MGTRSVGQAITLARLIAIRENYYMSSNGHHEYDKYEIDALIYERQASLDQKRQEADERLQRREQKERWNKCNNM